KKYYDRIVDIDVNEFWENNIKAIILDVDNTLLDFDLNIVEGLKEWYQKVHESCITAIIVSNSGKITKIEKVASLLQIEYIRYGMKPLKKGLKAAQKKLGVKSENIAVIGDQIFTDVIGANRCKMFSILVKPLDEKDIWMTKIKRPLENFVIKRYLKSRG
ncbi:MAG: YqeG family HAD IIIA-type phosphatase, partial [Clostridia bacterium]|nr:YqeG family HAD IIIA-type phosphatase [Clostridia bacterium]